MGALVEVKNPDGVYQEATINKLTDASIYTVGESMTSVLFYLLAHLVCTELIFLDDSQGLWRIFTEYGLFISSSKHL